MIYILFLNNLIGNVNIKNTYVVTNRNH